MPPGIGGGGVPAGAATPASLAERWGPHGYAIVGLNVRGSGQAKFPAQVYDVKAAIRFLRANAATYNLDAGRFATIGTSSGAWVATMAGVTACVAEMEGDLGNAGHSSAVQAVIDLFGPRDFIQIECPHWNGADHQYLVQRPGSVRCPAHHRLRRGADPQPARVNAWAASERVA